MVCAVGHINTITYTARALLFPAQYNHAPAANSTIDPPTIITTANG
jgi:hypothetical protein